MKISETYPSRYLKAADLKRRTEFTITSFAMEWIGQGADKEEKPVLAFRETDQLFVLNKTNAFVIANDLGDETDKWIGKKICLYPTRVEFGGKLVAAIRVQPAVAMPVTDDGPSFEEEAEGVF